MIVNRSLIRSLWAAVLIPCFLNSGTALSASPPAPESSSSWEKSFEKGRNEFYKGHLGAAEKILTDTLVTGRKSKLDDDRFTRNLTLLGATMYLQRKYKQAIPYYREAFTLMASLPESKHPESRIIFVARSRLGQCYYSEKKYKDAQLQFEQALRISDKKISKIPADDLAECYRGLADSYYCLENFLKAEKYYLKAFPYAKASSHHKDAKYVGEICFQLAYLALVRKDFNNASRYLKEASAFERNGAYSKAQIARLKKMHDYVRREQQQTMAPVKRQTK